MCCLVTDSSVDFAYQVNKDESYLARHYGPNVTKLIKDCLDHILVDQSMSSSSSLAQKSESKTHRLISRNHIIFSLVMSLDDFQCHNIWICFKSWLRHTKGLWLIVSIKKKGSVHGIARFSIISKSSKKWYYLITEQPAHRFPAPNTQQTRHAHRIFSESQTSMLLTSYRSHHQTPHSLLLHKSVLTSLHHLTHRFICFHSSLAHHIHMHLPRTWWHLLRTGGGSALQ